MMLHTHTSSFQQANSQNTPNNFQNPFSNPLTKTQNKLKIAIRPQNEYQVFTNIETLLSAKDSQNSHNVQKKQQQIMFSTSLMKAPSQGSFAKSNQNTGLSIITNDISDQQQQQHNVQLPFKKKNSCIGLSMTSKAINGYEKGSPSPQQPLTAKAAEQKQNNFYFPQKKNNINKRTIIKFGDKIYDNMKKPPQAGGVVITSENSPKNSQSQQKQSVPSFMGSSRQSMNAHIQEKKAQISNVNSYLQTEHVSRVEEQTLNNSKASPNGHQTLSNNTILVEYRKLQLVNYKHSLKIQQLEKLCQEQQEKLQEKDSIISSLQIKYPLESNLDPIKPIDPKKLVKVPSLARNNTTNKEQASNSNNNSFSTNDKKNFSGSTAQMSASILKSPNSPQRSLVYPTTMPTLKGLPLNQAYPSSTTDLISPKTQKHKTKLLSINLQNSDVKELINKPSLIHLQQPQYYSQFYDMHSPYLVEDQNSQMFQFNSPEKEHEQVFTFQSSEQEVKPPHHHHLNHHVSSNQDKIQQEMNKLLERMKKLFGSKNQQKNGK